MPKKGSSSLKKKIRARMERTGESYAVALAKLTSKKPPRKDDDA